MADKRIIDFSTLDQLVDDDKILIGNASDTYNVTVATFRAEVSAEVSKKADGAYLKSGYLYLTSGTEDVAGPIGPFSVPNDASTLPAISAATAGQFLTNDGDTAQWVDITNAEEVEY